MITSTEITLSKTLIQVVMLMVKGTTPNMNHILTDGHGLVVLQALVLGAQTTRKGPSMREEVNLITMEVTIPHQNLLHLVIITVIILGLETTIRTIMLGAATATTTTTTTTTTTLAVTTIYMIGTRLGRTIAAISATLGAIATITRTIAALMLGAATTIRVVQLLKIAVPPLAVVPLTRQFTTQVMEETQIEVILEIA
jgi:hypothetical protein